MPGQPRRMARRISELEQAAVLLALNVFRLAPDRYASDGKLHVRDNGARRWREAVSSAYDAATKLKALADFARTRAGLPQEPSVLERLRDDADGRALLRWVGRSSVGEPLRPVEPVYEFPAECWVTEEKLERLGYYEREEAVRGGHESIDAAGVGDGGGANL